MEETKKSKINFIVYIIVCVVVAISSFFMGYQYGKNPQTINSQISKSYAVGDVSDGTFISSNFYVPMFECANGDLTIDDTSYMAFDLDDDICTISMRFSLSYSSVTGNYTFGLLDNSYNSGNKFYSIFWGGVSTTILTSVNTNNMPYYKVLDNSIPTYYLKGTTNNNTQKNGYAFNVSINNGFDTSNVVGVQISKASSQFISYYAWTDDDEIVFNVGYIEFNYFDINGRHFIIQALGVSNRVLENFIDRTYYFDADSQGYNYGYSIGSQEGYTTGYDDGYSTGRDEGWTLGDRYGYNRGLQDANDYSFLGLISAVVDAPITIFKGLFNFSIFGTNMGQFLLSLASITLVIVIVRFVLARKE